MCLFSCWIWFNKKAETSALGRKRKSTACTNLYSLFWKEEEEEKKFDEWTNEMDVESATN